MLIIWTGWIPDLAFRKSTNRPPTMQEVDQLAAWRQSMALIERITHPNLALSKFYDKQKIIDVRRRPNSSLSDEAMAEIKQYVQAVIAELDLAIADPSIENINRVLDLPQVKIKQFADRATMARVRRRSAREGDCPLLVQEFKSLRAQLRDI